MRSSIRLFHAAWILAAAVLPAGCSEDDPPHVDGLTMQPSIPTGPSGTFLRVGDMIQARKHHRAAMIPGGDILVAGGEDGAGQVLASAELYRYTQGGLFMAGPHPMNAARKAFCMVPLDSVSGHRILVVGGQNGASAALDSADLFDPATFQFAAVAAPMAFARTRHAAVRLPNGNVFVCGGVDAAGTPLASCEVFDVTTWAFVRTASDLSAARADHTASLLATGKVLIAGGTDAAGNALASAELFDPGAGVGDQGTFAATGNLPAARAGHVAAPVNLGTYAGQWVLLGGFQGLISAPMIRDDAVAFDPAANGGVGVFSGIVQVMDAGRRGLTATVLTGGRKFLVVGGNAVNTPEVFDSEATTTGGSLALDADFVRTRDGGGLDTAMAAVTSGRRFHEAAWLLNGTILLCGGEDGATVTATAEVYNP
jgi:hypothetical protein